MSTACPIAIDALSPNTKRAVDPKTPAPARMAAARGMAPMPPRDLVTAQFVLTFDADPKIAETAQSSLANLDPRLANAILADTAMNPFVLAHLAEALVSRDADLARILLNPSTPNEAFFVAAERGSESICEVIANNQARVLKAPEIARYLTKNAKALRSTIDRVIDFLVRNSIILDGVSEFDQALLRLTGQERIEAASAIELDVPEEFLDSRFSGAGEDDESYLGEEPSDDRRMLAEDDALTEEEEKEHVSVEQLLKSMTTGQKVAFATRGNKSVRTLLMRDSNRVVALAAISAPTVTESEAVTAAQSRIVHADVIGFISRHRDWMKNYQVKLALVSNPKTPLPTAMKLVPSLQKRDLKMVGASKNVPAGVRNLAGKMAKERMG